MLQNKKPTLKLTMKKGVQISNHIFRVRACGWIDWHHIEYKCSFIYLYIYIYLLQLKNNNKKAKACLAMWLRVLFK